MIVYVVEGDPSDGYYGSILLYHGVDYSKAIDPRNWVGDYYCGATLYTWFDGVCAKKELCDKGP